MPEPLNPYRRRLAKHLEEHRPTEHKALKESGELEDHVDEVAESLDEGVEKYRQAYLKKNPVPSGPDRTAVAPREPTFAEEARDAAEGLMEAAEYLKARLTALGDPVENSEWLDSLIEANQVLSEIGESRPARQPPSALKALGHCARVIREHLRQLGPGEKDRLQALEPYFRGALDKAEEALAMPAFNPYHDQVKKHLEDHRPKERQALERSGNLESHVDDLSESLDEGVERYRQAYLQRHPVPKGANFVETARHLNHAKQIAEEVMTREYLPWDEEQLAEIGPSGGYED